MAGWLESRFGSPLYALHRTDVQDTLYRFALSLGVDVRFGAWVSTIDGETGQVTLKSGEVIAGDLIVGADGLNSLARSSLVGRPDPAVPTGELAYRVVLETDALKDDPELYDYAVTRKAIRIYYGPDAHVVVRGAPFRCSIAHITGQVYTLSAGKQLNMVIAVPDDLPPEVARQKGDVAEMRALFKDWDDILKRLLAKVDSVDKWRLRSRASVLRPVWSRA
jgi:salicylate hydroxylase